MYNLTTMFSWAIFSKIKPTRSGVTVRKSDRGASITSSQQRALCSASRTYP